jgi:uncharacterized protein (DUF2267 family)
LEHRNQDCDLIIATLAACKKRVKASSLDNVKAQCHMILEDKRIELKEYLNDLCHDKHKVIDNICKKYELENIEITNAKKQKVS